jgi:hypothetical protein
VLLSLISLIIGYIIVEYFDTAFLQVLLNTKNNFSINAELLGGVKLIPFVFSLFFILLGFQFIQFGRIFITSITVKYVLIYNYFFNEYYN